MSPDTPQPQPGAGTERDLRAELLRNATDRFPAIVVVQEAIRPLSSDPTLSALRVMEALDDAGFKVTRTFDPEVQP